MDLPTPYPIKFDRNSIELSHLTKNKLQSGTAQKLVHKIVLSLSRIKYDVEVHLRTVILLDVCKSESSNGWQACFPLQEDRPTHGETLAIISSTNANSQEAALLGRELKEPSLVLTTCCVKRWKLLVPLHLILFWDSSLKSNISITVRFP